MLFERIFSGNQSSKDMHSNQYAAGSVSNRTFSQRKAVEQGRTRIAAYRQSKLGWSVAPRSEYKKTEPQTLKSETSPAAGSTPNSFQEPPTRPFNPYA